MRAAAKATTWLLSASVNPTGRQMRVLKSRYLASGTATTQLLRAKLNETDFSRAFVVANCSGASLVNARFDGARLAADNGNQSTWPTRANFTSARLDGASFSGANPIAQVEHSADRIELCA